MKLFLQITVIFFLCFVCCSCETNSDTRLRAYPYGLSIDKNQFYLSVWSPDADSIHLNIYSDCESVDPISILNMDSQKNGNWLIELSDSLYGMNYSFQVYRNAMASKNVVDPYVKAVCANGNRAAFLDMNGSNPENWDKDSFLNRKKNAPLVLYELHVRDFSVDPNSGMNHKGKYLAFTEENTLSQSGHPSGLNYIESMGITHIHLLPVFDFASIDETLENPNYNWGYDPQNYFVPEGSYSTMPNKPEYRIIEFKKMVQSIHNRGIGVIMDVVYNHTYYLDKSNFQVWAPGYYYRQNEDGTYSNASACGNELASEKEKVRELIIESLKFWVREYHIDGFRFDLMGIMDVETMNLISKELLAINPGIVLYGEGWLAGSSPLADSLRAVKANMKLIPDYSAFSDEIRDGIKGHWSDEKDKGFVSGKPGLKPSVKFGIAGGIEHAQINYEEVNNSDFAWAKFPQQCINYVSCHDNHTLIDKLKISSPESDSFELRKMHLLAQTIVLTSQGIPFLHAGTEFYRTKFGEHNSFESPDSINMIDWSMAKTNSEAVDYIKDLITFRKENDAFWLKSREEINERLVFFDSTEQSGIYYRLAAGKGKNDFKTAIFIFAGKGTVETFNLPEGQWKLQFNQFKKVEANVQKSGELRIEGPNAMILTN